MNLTDLSLETIAAGAVPELFGHELERLVLNIADPNTDPTAARSMTMKLELKPQDESRERVEARVTFSVKLAGPEMISSSVFLTRSGGRVRAVTRDPRQPGLFDEPVVLEEEKNAGS
jgi:hypothetical protein